MESRIEFDPLLFQDRLHFLQCRLQSAGHITRVCAILAGHCHEHSRLSLNESVSEFRLRALDHASHILQPHADIVRVEYDHFAQKVSVERLAFGLHDDTLIFGFHIPCAHHSGGQARGCDYVGDCQIIRNQPIRLDLNLQLAHLPAEGAALGYSFDREQARLERPIGKGAQLHRRKLFRNQPYLEQIHRGGGERRHFGRLYAQRHLPGRFDQFFADHLSRRQYIGALFEHRGNDGKPLN